MNDSLGKFCHCREMLALDQLADPAQRGYFPNTSSREMVQTGRAPREPSAPPLNTLPFAGPTPAPTDQRRLHAFSVKRAVTLAATILWLR